MRKGTTSTGFEYEFDEERLDDMRFVDVMAVVVDPNAKPFDKFKGASQLLTMLLGPDLKDALYDHIGKSYGGRVPRAEVENALSEIMTGAGKDAEKNS